MVVWGGSREEWSGQREGAKGHEQTFDDNVHVHPLVLGNDFMCGHICQIHQIVHLKYIPFLVCQLDFHKAVQENTRQNIRLLRLINQDL